MIKTSALFLFCVLLTACASIVSNSAYPVAIDSWPSEAEYVVTNRNGVEVKRGQTPGIAILESGAGYFKKADYTVSFYKPGYREQFYRLASYTDDWYAGNILNIIGFFIDPATGAMWRMPDRVDAILFSDIPGAGPSAPFSVLPQ